MTISATLSKPAKNIESILGRPYTRIKIRIRPSADGSRYFAEKFTKTQAFHEWLTEEQLAAFLAEHAGTTFKSCIERTETETVATLANKRGEIKTLRKKIANENTATDAQDFNAAKTHAENPAPCSAQNADNGKHYILSEGEPIPFLIMLGAMTDDGKIIKSKYGKFRQVNRFLEFIDDIVPTVQKHAHGRPLRIVDFGSGKSYLTFAVHYYFTRVKKIDVHITGVDAREDVVAHCNEIAQKLSCEHLAFARGEIAHFKIAEQPDIVIALHACDTATDDALAFAVKRGATAILSVPCCQHELNAQLDAKKANPIFASLLKYGIIKERFAALATDALRAEYLESAGYKTQLLEFVNIEHTPKNILIRAVKKIERTDAAQQNDADATTDAATGADGSRLPKSALASADALTDALGVSPSLRALLQG